MSNRKQDRNTPTGSAPVKDPFASREAENYEKHCFRSLLNVLWPGGMRGAIEFGAPRRAAALCGKAADKKQYEQNKAVSL